jgi:hypothetical protein
MSQYPRRVLTSGYVTWDPGSGHQVNRTFIRAGTLVDAKPGSALEAAYAGLGLSGVIPAAQTGDEACLDRSAQGN